MVDVDVKLSCTGVAVPPVDAAKSLVAPFTRAYIDEVVTHTSPFAGVDGADVGDIRKGERSCPPVDKISVPVNISGPVLFIFFRSRTLP